MRYSKLTHNFYYSPFVLMVIVKKSHSFTCISSYTAESQILILAIGTLFSFCSQDCFCVELADESRHTLNIRDETGDMFNIEPVQVKKY